MQMLFALVTQSSWEGRLPEELDENLSDMKVS